MRVLLGAIFVLAGASKLVDQQPFVAALVALNLFSGWLIDLIRICLPIFEVIVGILLVIGLLTRFSSLAATVLLFTFVTVYFPYFLTGRPDINCGCFAGLSDGKIDIFFLFRNSVLFLIALYIYSQHTHAWSFDRRLTKRCIRGSV